MSDQNNEGFGGYDPEHPAPREHDEQEQALRDIVGRWDGPWNFPEPPAPKKVRGSTRLEIGTLDELMGILGRAQAERRQLEQEREEEQQEEEQEEPEQEFEAPNDSDPESVASTESEPVAGEPNESSVDPEQYAQELTAAYENGDIEQAFMMAEQYLQTDPANEDVQLVLMECQEKLDERFEQRVGSLKQKPALQKEFVDVASEVGEQAGYILRRIDGTVSYEDLFNHPAVPRVDAYRIIADLINDGIIVSTP